jgi:TonB family protein
MSLATLDRSLGVIWLEVLRHLWQSALVVLPLFFLAYVLRTAPARWSHRLWVAALAKLFVPLALLGPLAGAAWERRVHGHAVPGNVSASAGYRVLVTVIGAGSGAPVSPAIDRFPAPFFTLCTLAYLAVTCWLVIRTTRDLAAARRLARAVVPVDGDRKAKLLSAVSAAGIAGAHVVVSDANVIPAVVGMLRPRIIVPARLIDALEVDELTAVLLHEEMHRRHADAAIAVVQRVASSILFFFPLLAPMQRRLRNAAELRCDEDALRAGAEPRAYARALARTVNLGLDPSPAPFALADGNPSLVARRLAKLRAPKEVKTMTKHKIAIAAASLILAAGIFLPVAPARVIDEAGSANPELDRLWNLDRRVTLQLTKTPAAQALEAIAKAGGFHLDIEGPDGCCPVNLSLTDAPLRQALEEIAAQAELQYQVIGSDGLRVELFSALLPTKDMKMPVLVSSVEPIYPKEAIEARAGGKVILQAVIRADGTIGDLKILSQPDGWPSFGEAALAAVRQRVYRPALKDGEPVSIYFTILIDFRLDEADGGTGTPESN